MGMNSNSTVAATHFPARRTAWLATAAMCGLGALAWLLLGLFIETREAWDSTLYFLVVLPISVVAGVIAGWRHGGPGWRWPLAYFGGQLLMIAPRWFQPGEGSLWPLALVFLFVCSLPCWLAARFVIRVRERVR